MNQALCICLSTPTLNILSYVCLSIFYQIEPLSWVDCSALIGNKAGSVFTKDITTCYLARSNRGSAAFQSLIRCYTNGAACMLHQCCAKSFWRNAFWDSAKVPAGQRVRPRPLAIGIHSFPAWRSAIKKNRVKPPLCVVDRWAVAASLEDRQAPLQFSGHDK